MHIDDNPWTTPPYADPESFTEREITLDGGGGPVGGTVTVPTGAGPFPGAVLLGGAGPFDRDGAFGANRPLKDIAWGLASRGVAVLRFDKPTHTRPAMATEPGFTITAEYVPAAVSAVRLLRAEARVDASRITVLGHSGGGKVAPRVAAAEPLVAGLVILAGDTQPMPESIVRVLGHLTAISPEFMDAATAEAMLGQARLAGSVELSLATSAADLPYGMPASYWLDLRAYDPVATAAALDIPMLILQGGRDYQVTVADDLSRWRAGLGHRPDVEIGVHDADDHMFFPGDGPSTPASYALPQHVDPAVVDRIAGWLA